MKLLVTGASGFVGRELLRRLPEKTEAIALARRTPVWADAATKVEWVEIDVTQPGFQRLLPNDLDATVHLAQSRYDREFPRGADDVVDVNVAATARLLDHAREAGAKRFVLASTATVYRQGDAPLDEGAALDPSSFYAASKRAAELLAAAYSSEVPASAVRLFTTYGAGQRGRLIAELIERVRSGQAVTVQGERGLVLSPIHVSDVAETLLAACAAPGPDFEVLNAGGPEALGIAELAREIGRALGREPILHAHGTEEPGGFTADTSRLRSRFPHVRPLPFSDGLRLTLETETHA